MRARAGGDGSDMGDNGDDGGIDGSGVVGTGSWPSTMANRYS